MLPNNRALIPNLTNTEASDASNDTNIVGGEEQLHRTASSTLLPRTNTARSVNNTPPAGFHRRTDDDTSSGPRKTPGGITFARAASGSSSEGVEMPPTPAATSVLNISGSTSAAVNSNGSAASGYNTTGSTTPPNSLTPLSDYFNVTRPDFANLIVSTNLPQTTVITDSEIANAPTIPVCEHGSPTKSPGGTVTLCACRNIADLSGLVGSFANVDPGMILPGQGITTRKRDDGTPSPSAAPSNAADASGSVSLALTENSPTKEMRKRKSPSPGGSTSPAKMKVFETSSGSLLPSSRKRSSDDFEDTPPPKKTASSENRPSSSELSRLTSSSANTTSPQTPGHKRSADTSSDNSIPPKRFAPSVSSTPTSSRKRHPSKISANTSTPIRPSFNRRILPSPGLSPINRGPAPLDLPALGVDSTPMSSSSASIAFSATQVASSGSGVSENPAEASLSNTSLATAAAASESDVNTARSLTPPPLPPLPAVQPALLPLPMQLVAQPPAAVAPPAAHRGLERNIGIAIDAIKFRLKQISSDGFPRINCVLDLVCRLQRHRSTLRRLERELTTQDPKKRKTPAVVQKDFDKVKPKLTDIIAQIRRLTKD